MSASTSSFTEVDWKSINNIRGLAVDMVQKANSGHPGMPLGMAPVAHVLFSRFVKFASSNPHWINRDRFVLSNGHGCALLYTLLHLCGYKVSMKDLEAFRQLDSITPGHPERHMTEGVEVTTGPLGQGLANAVGMAIASKHTAATFNKPGYEQLFDNYVYVFAGDGCLMEGVTSEASSLAGHLGLGNLICIYDDNKISIDGSTDVAFTEDVGKRYEAYGWHVQHVQNGDSDLDAMAKAIESAKNVTDKPSIICLRTTIGYGSKNQGTHHVHGAPLGAEDYKNLKVKLGLPEASFTVDEAVTAQYASIIKKGEEALQAFNTLLAKYTTEFPEQAKLFNRLITGDVLPQDMDSLLTKYTLRDTNSATRKLSQQALNIFADAIPELIGGSADLAASNLTDLKNSTDFQKGKYDGRILRFGVREHAMGAICNGIAAYGGYIPFCATFLNFVGYMWGAMRLSALSHHQVIYVMTHDSIGLGEDGPTHQPIEVVALMRATPNFYVFRPADGNEVFGSYKQALLAKSTPSCICLTRQDLPKLEHSSVEKVAQGGYVVFNEEKKVDLVFVATGSEVSLCIDTAKKLEKESGIVARVVSMPCLELFEKQSAAYKQSILLDGSVPVVSVEVLATLGWQRVSHVQLGLDKFGTSGPYKQVFEKFGFVPNALAAKSVKIVEFFKQHPKRLYNLAEEITF